MGGGINGLAIGTRLQEEDLGQVEIFDRTGASATIASGAQVFPYVSGENSFLHDEERKLLPYELAYLPAILQHFGTSFADYGEMAIKPDSGITPSLMLELARKRDSMSREMQDLMDARLHSIDPRSRLHDYGFRGYYEMQSFGVDALAHFKFLKKRFEDQGGIWHSRAHVSKQAVQTFDQGVIVIAAGHREDELRDRPPLFPAQKHLGMSAIYRTNELLPQNPVIGFDDYLIRTHADQLGLTVGGFVFNGYGGVSSSTQKLAEADTTRLAQDCLEEIAEPFGPWKGLPVGLLRRITPSIRFGVRSLGTFGPTVEQDYRRPNQVWVSGSGHVGISLAHGLKREAAYVVREIHGLFTKGMPYPQELLRATGDPDSPREAHTSTRFRERKPSIELQRFQDKVDSIHKNMAAVAIMRGMGRT